jgi:hypothetical protein
MPTISATTVTTATHKRSRHALECAPRSDLDERVSDEWITSAFYSRAAPVAQMKRGAAHEAKHDAADFGNSSWGHCATAV